MQRTQADHKAASRDTTLRGKGPWVLSGYYLLEGLNSCAACYYFYYLFFYLQKHFGFGNAGNLTVCALNGFVYIFSAWHGGKFAQRYGYYTALLFGFCTMIAALLCGSFFGTVARQVIVMVFWTIGVCFTWPSLEALVSEEGPARTLPRRLGIYNLVWSGAGALTYFWGGAVFERFGQRSLFLLPAMAISAQLLLLGWLSKHRSHGPRSSAPESAHREIGQLADKNVGAPRLTPQTFLRLAWFANPFAYIAINTLVAVIPELTRQLHLSPTFAGFFWSIWFFVRLGTFLLLWQWTTWHYHFSWLWTAFLGLAASFTAILLVPNLLILALAQIVFGLSVGLIYYSSLFYSMDVGETKGEHGGIHEAAIGFGIFLGPAVGAAALRILPSYPNSAAWAVSALLLSGFALLFVVKRKGLARQ